MARIDLKNEDLSFSIGYQQEGTVTLDIMITNTDETLKNAAQKIGTIKMTLDESLALINEIRSSMIESIR